MNDFPFVRFGGDEPWDLTDWTEITRPGDAMRTFAKVTGEPCSVCGEDDMPSTTAIHVKCGMKVTE